MKINQAKKGRKARTQLFPNGVVYLAIPIALAVVSSTATGGTTCAVPALETGCTYTFPVLAPELIVSPSYASSYDLGSDLKVIYYGNSSTLDLCQSSTAARTSCISYTKDCLGKPLETSSCDDGGGITLVDDGSGSNRGISLGDDAIDGPDNNGNDNGEGDNGEGDNGGG